MLASGQGTGELGIYGQYDSVSSAATTATLAADLRLDKPNQLNANDAYILNVVFHGPSTDYQVGFGLNGTSGTELVYTFDSASSTTQVVVAAGPMFPVGRWTRVTLRATVAQDGGTVHVTVGGVPLTNGARLTATVASGAADLFVGLPYAAAGNDGWTVAVDNVVFDSSP